MQCRLGLDSDRLMQMDLGEDDDDAFMTPDEEDDLEVLQRHRESAQADEWAGDSCAPKTRCTACFSRGRVAPAAARTCCCLNNLLALHEV